MKQIVYILKNIEELSPLQNGVFSNGDLKNIIQPNNTAFYYRIVSQLIESGIIERFSREYYITKDVNLSALSQNICSDSYISFGTVLAKNLIIGSVPEYRIRAVKKGPTRVYKNSKYTIEHFKITENLWTGYKTENGINIAFPEKAFVDTLYYYQKGIKFNFDIYSDIYYEELDEIKIKKYLDLYKSKKFVTFVNGVING
ncbi:MAG: hypothetical protein ABFR36_01100 [Acidobacteriota bacterium]